ncbi:MAG: ABC transporter ATP-binding protein [Clostridia bacterium]|nr:ABC transporter ATP-binding protein [Clostridia bacterium]
MINLKKIEMTYDDHGTKINALKLKELQVKDGEKVAFIGSSGCGKTTLFNLISGMLTPTKGNVIVEDIDITTLTESERDLFRANHIGYIFQDFNLFPDFTVLQNVVLPMSFSKRYSKNEMEKEALSMLKRVGLENKKDQKVKTLSGGEKQRVAIARSIVNKPNVILADEPTGNLDYKNGAKIMDLILQIAKEEKATLLVITHNNSQLELFDRSINIEDLNEAIK